MRLPKNLLKQVLVDGYTLGQLLRRRPGLEIQALRYRFRKQLAGLCARPRNLEVPAGPLVLLADGIWFRFNGRPWVLYLSALKSCDDKTACFLDPIMIEGAEGVPKWKRVVEAIPQDLRARIRAIVVDNVVGMKGLAKQQGWVLQLCQFHLLLKLNVHRRRRRKLIGGDAREALYQLVRRALDAPEGPELDWTRSQLEELVAKSCGTQRIDAIAREFLYSLSYYRASFKHPELRLPRTTNVLESMARIVRDLLRRNRLASNPKSVLQWVTALIRLRPSLVCNGTNHQQN